MQKRLTGYHLIILCLLILSFVQCNPGKISNKKHSIAIVVSTLNNPWFVFLAETAAAKSKALGYDAKIFDSQNNTALESDHFDNIIVSEFDAILFNSTDANGSVANVLKAKAANIPVFCMDREVNAVDAPTSQILSDSYSGAVAIGKYFTQLLHKKGNYVELLGLVGDNNTWARSKGFHSVVDEFPELKMVARQSADFDRNKSMDVMETIMQANPDIDAVFCGNDAMALGAYQAVLAAGKAGKVKIFGFDGAKDAIDGIASGKITATVMQFPVLMARTSADLANDYINGKRGFSTKTPVEVVMVTPENVSKYQSEK